MSPPEHSDPRDEPLEDANGDAALENLPSAKRELLRMKNRAGAAELREELRRIAAETDPDPLRPPPESERHEHAVVVLAPHRLPDPIVVRDTQKDLPPVGVWTPSDEKSQHINVAGQTGKLGPAPMIGGYELPSGDRNAQTVFTPVTRERRRHRGLAWALVAVLSAAAILAIAAMTRSPGRPGANVESAAAASLGDVAVGPTAATADHRPATATATSELAIDPTAEAASPATASARVRSSQKPSASETPATAKTTAPSTQTSEPTATQSPTTTAAPKPSASSSSGRWW